MQKEVGAFTKWDRRPHAQTSPGVNPASAVLPSSPGGDAPLSQVGDAGSAVLVHAAGHGQAQCTALLLQQLHEAGAPELLCGGGEGRHLGYNILFMAMGGGCHSSKSV